MIYNEIRIGNTVSDGYNECYIQSFNTKFANIRDTKIYSKESMVSKELIKNLQGVKITEEFLISVGFEHHLEVDLYIKEDLALQGGIQDGFMVTTYGSYITKVEYVHQLENLFYSITQKELW